MTRRHWVTLAFILAVGLTLRVAYFTTALHAPGYVWEDPDDNPRVASAFRRKAEAR